MKDKLSINIKIDNSNLPLVINREEEEKYRRAAKLLNQSVLEYRKNFKNQSSKDIMAMAAFQFVLKYLDLKKDTEYSHIVHELRNLTDDINDFLDEKVDNK